MAKTSRKGATSSHTIKAKGGCLQHNRRTQMSANVDPSRTHLNTSWEHDRIKNLASTRSLIRHAEKLYTTKTGQKCQASFAPLKESCVVVKDSSTIEEAKEFASLVEQATGIRCLGIWFHKDEGHSRSKFRPDEPYQCNNHIHYLWDCQNPETGKAIPLKRSDMSLMQDLASKAFGMERGIPASISGLKHLPAAEYKLQEVLKENEHLREVNRELMDVNQELQKVRTGLLAKIEDAWKWKGKFKDAEKEIKEQKALLTVQDNTIAQLKGKIEKIEQSAHNAYKTILAKHKEETDKQIAEANGKVNTAEKRAKTAEQQLANVREENRNLSYTVNKLTQKLWGQSENQIMRDTIVGDVLEFNEHPDYRDEWVATWRGYTVATAKVQRNGTVDITEWHPDQESTRQNHAQNLEEAWERIQKYTRYEFEEELGQHLGQGGGMRR